MPTTSQMLADYPDIVLQVIAELRGAILDAAENRREAVDMLSAQVTDPTSLLMAYQEVTEFHPQAQDAFDRLLTEGGEVVEAQFSREFGGIRQMGPARLEREQPWHAPESVAELLYYYGLIGRGFKGAGQNAHTIIYVPSDVIPWLPSPAGAEGESGLSLIPVPPPPASRMLHNEDALLEDMGTLLGFLHTDSLRLEESGRPNRQDIDRLAERLQSAALVVPTSFAPSSAQDRTDPERDPPSGEASTTRDGEPAPAEQDEGETEQLPTAEDVRLALMLHLAKRLGWLRLNGDQVKLTGNRVYEFLEMNRPEQRHVLFQSWQESPEWNDLCRVPVLNCTNLDNWSNAPRQTRAAVLDLLRNLVPGAWYSQRDLLAAVKEHAPDFQRPTGDYESWYVRDAVTNEFLRGFDFWERVEGALLHFLLVGPLYWLSAIDLAEPSAGDDMLISLSQSGARWLELDAGLPDEPPRRPIKVGDDFTVRVPLGTPLGDRFRVERFAHWQASYPAFVYQITQRGLARAGEEGISSSRILDFLRSKGRALPENVEGALRRFEQPQGAGEPTP